MALKLKTHRKPELKIKKDITNLKIGLYYTGVAITSFVLSLGILSLIIALF
jgi:hypothetical protein